MSGDPMHASCRAAKLGRLGLAVGHASGGARRSRIACIKNWLANFLRIAHSPLQNDFCPESGWGSARRSWTMNGYPLPPAQSSFPREMSRPSAAAPAANEFWAISLHQNQASLFIGSRVVRAVACQSQRQSKLHLAWQSSVPFRPRPWRRAGTTGRCRFCMTEFAVMKLQGIHVQGWPWARCAVPFRPKSPIAVRLTFVLVGCDLDRQRDVNSVFANSINMLLMRNAIAVGLQTSFRRVVAENAAGTVGCLPPSC